MCDMCTPTEQRYREDMKLASGRPRSASSRWTYQPQLSAEEAIAAERRGPQLVISTRGG
jgi:hypothetical protein